MRTVVIIEPHPLFRLGLRQLLSEALPQITVKDYDFSSLEDTAFESSEECDLLLLSLKDSQDAAQAAAAAVERFSPKRMLLLGDEENLPSSGDLLPESVAGVVRREAAPEVLKASVTLVAAGGTCFPARWSPKTRSEATRSAGHITNGDVQERYQPTRWPSPFATSRSNLADSEPARGSSGPSAPEGLDFEFNTPIKPGSAAHKESQLLGLTPRQYEVLVLLARGYPMKKVGRTLNISVATAKAHTETLYQRLDVHNRNAAVYTAVTRGATLGWAHQLASQQRAGSN